MIPPRDAVWREKLAAMLKNLAAVHCAGREMNAMRPR
jgi:hypothetical protein